MQYKDLYKYFISEDEQWGYNWQNNQQGQQYNQQQQQQQYYQQQEGEEVQEEEVQEGEEQQQAAEDNQQQYDQNQNQNQQQPWNQWNTTGYASADLKLLSVEYSLFNYLPFNFCGEWVRSGHYNSNPCPYDGTYTFTISYDLPWDDGDITTWFATGWQGVSDLTIYKDSTEIESNELLASCIMHWKTYVTQADESDGWKTLPSAAQAAIIMVSVLAFMLCCCTYLACCRRRSRRRHITDADYAPSGGSGDDTGASKAEFTLFDDEKTRQEKKKKAKDDFVHKINLSLKEPDWV